MHYAAMLSVRGCIQEQHTTGFLGNRTQQFPCWPADAASMMRLHGSVTLSGRRK